MVPSVKRSFLDFLDLTGTPPSTQMHVISRHYEKKRNEGGKGEV